MSESEHRYSKRLYNVWERMLARCNKPSAKEYKLYGARGIKVCEEWHDMQTFAKWAFGNGYDESAERGKCTLDRIDVDGNYSPDNCRWVSQMEQMRNTRYNRKITFNGETRCLAEWKQVTGIDVARRLSLGWSVEDAITRPKAGTEFRKVKMYAKNGEYIRTFEDRGELYKMFPTHTARIKDCCEGKVYRAFGYHWEYAV